MRPDYAAMLHGMGHLFIDHPNDATIAVQEKLLPSDNDWKFGEKTQDYGISSEYRADNGCMYVMAFTKCFYQGREFTDTLTYMPIDIQALQHIYGKNEFTRAHDTAYILLRSKHLLMVLISHYLLMIFMRTQFTQFMMLVEQIALILDLLKKQK